MRESSRGSPLKSPLLRLLAHTAMERPGTQSCSSHALFGARHAPAGRHREPQRQPSTHTPSPLSCPTPTNLQGSTHERHVCTVPPTACAGLGWCAGLACYAGRGSSRSQSVRPRWLGRTWGSERAAVVLLETTVAQQLGCQTTASGIQSPEPPRPAARLPVPEMAGPAGLGGGSGRTQVVKLVQYRKRRFKARVWAHAGQ